MLRETLKFFAPITLFIVVLGIIFNACNYDDNPKQKTQTITSQYKEGDIVYLKPDSTIGVIGVITNWTSGTEYRIGYKNNEGVIEYHDFTETQIFGKKQN